MPSGALGETHQLPGDSEDFAGRGTVFSRSIQGISLRMKKIPTAGASNVVRLLVRFTVVLLHNLFGRQNAETHGPPTIVYDGVLGTNS